MLLNYKEWENYSNQLVNEAWTRLGLISLNEQEELDWLDQEDLTSGEVRALARDLQLITKPQFAALYLKALGKYKFSKGDGPGSSVAERIEQDSLVTSIPGIEPFCNQDWRSGGLYIGSAGLADALGLESKGTVTRTINKFYLMLTQGSGSHEEVVYPKLIAAFEWLKSKPDDVIKAIAAEAIQDPASATQHRSTLKQRAITKEQGLAIGSSVWALFKDLIKNDFFKRDTCKVQRLAINKIANESGLDLAQITGFYREFLTKQGALDKFNWCSSSNR